MAASESGVLYSLLSLSASSVLLNVALLVWQLLRVHVERGFTFLKHALVLLSMAYILVAISVCFILLHMDTHSDVLCKAGGFLIIFASQETLWLLASASIGLYLWRKRTLSQDFQRWNKAIFYLVTIAQTIVILPISFLPFLNISYFNSVDEYYFHCTPLHLPNTEGWALSALVLVLDWVAFTISLAALTLVSVRYSTCRTPHLTNVAKYFESGIPAKRLQRMLFVCFCLGVGCWLLPLLLTSVSYFSGGGLDKFTVQAALGFLLVLTLIAHPLCLWGYQFLAARFFQMSTSHVETKATALANAVPDRLNHATKLYSPINTISNINASPESKPFKDKYQDPGISHYLSQWRDGAGNLVAGVLRVYSPSCHLKWENELRVAVKLGLLDHPNIVRFLWAAPANNFTNCIREFAGDVNGKHSSIMCRSHHPHGTLKEFLQYSVEALTEHHVHKLSLDIASGLNFLHMHGIVHNALSSLTVYIIGGDEKTGFHVAIGDFDRSYEVLVPCGYDEDTTLQLSQSPLLLTRKPTVAVIESHLDYAERLAGTQFVPDIRAFGMVILCVLVAKSEYEEKLAGKKSLAWMQVRTRTLSKEQQVELAHLAVCSSFTEPYSEALIGSNKLFCASELHSSHHRHGNCTCSQRVVDVRVLRDSNRDKHKHSLTCHFSLGKSAESGDCAFEERESMEQFSASSKEEQVCTVHVMGSKQQDSWPQEDSVRQSTKSTGSLPSSSESLSSPVGEGSLIDSDAESRCSSRISLRRGAHKILTNGSFISSPRKIPDSCISLAPSKVDAATDTCNFPISGCSSNAGSEQYGSADSISCELQEAPPLPPARDYTPLERNLVSLPQTGPLYTRRQNIQTIYEEEEVNESGSNNGTPNTPEPSKHVELQPLLVPLHKESLEALDFHPKQKRLSFASTMDDSIIDSMIESVLSMDSGVGSSHYDTMSNATDQDGSIVLGHNTGSRQVIYQPSAECHTTAAVHRFAQRSNVHTKVGETPRKLRIYGYKTDQESTPTSVENILSQCGSEASEDYEHSAKPHYRTRSARKEKRPCVGHHKFVDGSKCSSFCASQIPKSHEPPQTSFTSLLKPKPRLPPKPKHLSDSKTHDFSDHQPTDHSSLSVPELESSHAELFDIDSKPTSQDCFIFGKHIAPLITHKRSEKIAFNYLKAPRLLQPQTDIISQRVPITCMATNNQPNNSASSSPSEERSTTSSSSLQLDDPLFRVTPPANNDLLPPLPQYHQPVSNPHSEVYANLNTTAEEQQVRAIVDFMKASGKLGFYTERLVPLLADCYAETPAPSTEVILQRLGDELSSSSVI